MQEFDLEIDSIHLVIERALYEPTWCHCSAYVFWGDGSCSPAHSVDHSTHPTWTSDAICRNLR